MKSLRTALRPDGCCALLACSLLLSAVAFAAEPAKQGAARDSAACELVLEDEGIEKLTLVDDEGLWKEFARPGRSIFLPPGRYRIQEIWLKTGEYERDLNPGGQDLLTLSPERPSRLKVGATLSPTVTAKRRGRLLVLGCQLRDAEGRKYFAGDRTNPPQFTIYQGDREIASDSFEYG
jgi:hypothetical protein